jgi:class 3 adenylate cyclase
MLTDINKPEVVRRYAKYVFLDVVRFSERSSEAQSEVVYRLNAIVRGVLTEYEVKDQDCILIPTGDGMCIALISPELSYDVHLQLALSILESLEQHNREMKNVTRQFQVRMGINQNTDILVTDINEKRNVAGAGVNMAARIMDKADGNQILVSQSAHDELQPSEQYMNKFNFFEAETKHGLRLRVYQYIGEGHVGLNFSTPSEFEPKRTPDTKFSKLAAYYFAHAIKQRHFIVKEQGHGQNNYSLTVMLWFLAKDSEGASDSTEIAPYEPTILGEGKLTLKEIFSHYESIDFEIIYIVAEFVRSELSNYRRWVAAGGFGLMPLFITAEGRDKLKKEWPNIWEELDLDTTHN